jgi:peptide/nickel transport system substrate-binding protein
LVLVGCAAQVPPGTVFYASGADLQSINPLVTIHPLAKQVQRYVLFTTLARYDSALRPVPYLAESWRWEDGGRSLVLELRRGLRWHDGVPTTARDVVFTLEAAKDPSTGYPRIGDLGCLEESRALGEFTARLRYCRPQPAFPDVLVDLAILPAHHLSGLPRESLRVAAFNRRPVGNGPFRFVSHRPNRRWVFASNREFPESMGGPPALDRLVVVVVDEATTKLAGLVTGELHVAGILPMHASVVSRTTGLEVVDYPALFTYGLVWNTSRPPFDDRRLRRALTMAIDRERIVTVHLYGFGEAAHGPVPPAHPLAAAVSEIAFDPAGAAALLDSLGWRSGKGGVRRRDGGRLSFELLTVGSADNVLEQLIQSDLAAVGVEVRIRQLELGTFLSVAQGGDRDYDALVTGIPGDLALGYLEALFHSRRLSGPLQMARYRNAEVDRAFDDGDLARVQGLVAQDVPITFLYHGRGVQGISGRLRGVAMDLRGELATLSRWHLARTPR